MDFPMNNPQMPKRRTRVIVWLGLIIFALVLAVPAIANFITEWFWYRELGRTDVYWTLTWGKWALGGVVGAAFFLVVFVNIFIALRSTSEDLWRDLHRRLHTHALDMLDRTLRRVVLWGSAAVTFLFALVIGRSAAQYWPKFLLFLQNQHVGVTDPIFHRDTGFYLFRLPIYELLSSVLFNALIFALVLTGIVYLTTRAIRTVRGIPVFSPAVQAHLSILLGAIFIVKALQYFLGRFSLMSNSVGSFVGPGYADVHGRIPGLAILMVIALVAAGVMLVNIRRRSIALPIGALVIMILSSILVLGVYPAFLQRFRVDPNEVALETPFIKNHINLTRQAYGLDKVVEKSFSPVPRVSGETISASSATMNNIRLWDYRPLSQVYSQRQELRTYYSIANVDIDRYTINGLQRQVMLSARELNVENIQGQKTWLNKHLIYTHGYGVVMSPVNEVDAEKGEPTFFINDIPPKSTHPELNISRPEIYFGELPGDYVVVRTSKREFDYPSGEDNAYSTYEGTAGIPLKNPLVRALMAFRFNAVNLLISDYIKPESRLVYRRQIVERAQALAPFLVFDKDPYIVVGKDGKLYWILDAYTGSSRYPYSRTSTLQTATGDDIALNYVRNPVKVVIDAYNGSTTFYLADAKEPFIRAWQQIFPNMFKPLAEMPAGLTQHVRVPEGLFNTISDVYRRYHMTEVDTFYQQEDLWDIPQVSSGLRLQSSADNMEAYYIAMSLPGSSQPEYLLIRPYTPREKKNMIAWLSARNDPEGYGQLLVYNFPKQSLVFGPEQVQARINQDTDISAAVSLWNQSGSTVLWGNLLVIPVGETILYVQPVYLQAERSQIPELQRVIVADQQRVVMRRSLEEAQAVLTGGVVAPTRVTSQPPAPGVSTPPMVLPITDGASREHARKALEYYDRAQKALKDSDWATYGREMEGVRRELEALNK